ncbi:hypothetical protein BER2_4597 [plant metagenome]
MLQALAGKRYGPVLVALALGDQQGVALVMDIKVLLYDFEKYQSLMIFRGS